MATHTIARLIKTPGYHIRPKYDLRSFRGRQTEKGERKSDFSLSLTAMIDMFSTLVIFLLLNFSATGEAYFVNKKVTIPTAAHSRPLESAPLISIGQDSVTLDSNLVGGDTTSLTEHDEAMPRLRDGLRKLHQLAENLKAAGVIEKNQINIQADESTPVQKIKMVMNILVQEGFTGVNFAVREVNPDEL